MAREVATEFVAECLWPDVHEGDLRALDARAGEESERASVRYLGSLLMREDEVVLCLFEGAEPAVRQAAERADVPFERILEASRSPWPIAHTA